MAKRAAHRYAQPAACQTGASPSIPIPIPASETERENAVSIHNGSRRVQVRYDCRRVSDLSPRNRASQCPARGDFHPHSALIATPLERRTDRNAIQFCLIRFSSRHLAGAKYLISRQSAFGFATPETKKVGMVLRHSYFIRHELFQLIPRPGQQHPNAVRSDIVFPRDLLVG